MATLISVVRAVRDPAFVDMQTGPMLPLLLVSCLMPLVFITPGTVLYVIGVSRLVQQQRMVMRDYEEPLAAL